MLSSHVLILNRGYLPIHVTTVRRALILLYQGHAKVVGEQFETFDFFSWLDLEIENHHETIGLVHGEIRVPRVLLLNLYDRLPQRSIRFSRHNIFLRDLHICQYCGDGHPRGHLNLDHVIPRSRGGKTNWENVVCCCLDCNRRKGGLLPQEAGMSLIKEPRIPRWVPLMHLKHHEVRYREWRPFLTLVESHG